MSDQARAQRLLAQSKTAAEITATDYAPIRWAIPGVIPEGLTLLAGPPKIGKSTLALNLSYAVASGTLALGKITTQPGDVIHLSLEDGERRLKDRLAGRAEHTDRLRFWTQWERMDNGGGDDLIEVLRVTPECRLVVVDLFKRLRRPTNNRQNAYDADYEAMQEFKTIADDFDVPIVVVHHTNQRVQPKDGEAPMDFVERVSGTAGLIGAVDTVAVLSRTRGAADGVLQITGRDVEERSYALKSDFKAGTWSLMDEPPEVLAMTDTQQAVASVIRVIGDGGVTFGPKDVADALPEIKDTAVRKTFTRFAERGQLIESCPGEYGRYRLIGGGADPFDSTATERETLPLREDATPAVEFAEHRTSVPPFGISSDIWDRYQQPAIDSPEVFAELFGTPAGG